MPSHQLACSPTPLQQYLKALGLFRLVAEQSDRTAQACWREDEFILETSLTNAEIEQFFLNDYQPSPILTPWNGGSGFYGTASNQRFIRAIAESTSPRLSVYQKSVNVARAALSDLGIGTKPSADAKLALIVRLRNSLPDAALQWLDCAIQVSGDSLSFPPLVGSGGNDGNLDFSKLFMEVLDQALDLKTGQPKKDSELWLQSALWGAIAPKCKVGIKSGQFSPVAGGNVNASSDGYVATASANPWDLLLAIEGCLLFYGATTRRHGVAEQGGLSYPFTVRSSTLGYASAAEENSRAESWLPLWNQPTGLLQLKALFREGRSRVDNRPTRDGLDFARAVSTMGVNRGISEFVRYGFLERNGKAHYAVPLGRFRPKQNPQVSRLAEIDAWLEQLRSSCRRENAPLSVLSCLRRLEQIIFELTIGKASVLDVLIVLGQTEAVLARSPKFVEESYIRPVPQLSTAWVNDSWEDSPEFRLALALAGAGIRQRLVPVKQGRYPQWNFDTRSCVWSPGSLPLNLIRVLRRKTIESEQSLESVKLPYPPFAALADISSWIYVDEENGDSRIEAIARGLSLCNLYGLQIAPKFGVLPASYSLSAICHHWCSLYRPDRKGREQLTIPYVSGLISRLASGDCRAATELAVRRLRASGINPVIQEGIWEPYCRSLRIAASLAFPIADADVNHNLIERIRVKEKKNA